MGKQQLKFFNYECYTEPETILYQKEADVITSIIQEILDNSSSVFRRGTCIIYGQRYGEDVKCLMRFNFSHKEYRHQFLCAYDEIAEKAISEVLSHSVKNNPQNDIELNAKTRSSIYRNGNHKVLILNTTTGRIFASLYADFKDGGHSESTKILLAISEIFSHMMKEDQILQDSANLIILEDMQLGRLVRRKVYGMFGDCELAALKEWEKWREPIQSYFSTSIRE